MCQFYCALCEWELKWPIYGNIWRHIWRALYSIDGETYLSRPHNIDSPPIMNKVYPGNQGPVWSPPPGISRGEFSRIVIKALFSEELPEHQSHFIEDHQNIIFFHSACWDHLARFLGATQLNLDNIFEVPFSIQFRRSFLTGEIRATWNPLLPTRPVFTTRDYHLVSPILIKRRERLTTSPKEYQQDPFARLPIEIKLEITEFMSTNDYLHLRQVSRAMFPLFDSPAFWRTRFQTHSDRGYLDFLADPEIDGNWDTLKAEDWRKIYRQSSIRGTVAGPPTKKTKRSPSKGRPTSSRWIHSWHGVWVKMKWLQTQLEINSSITEIANEVSQFEMVSTDSNIKWYWQTSQSSSGRTSYSSSRSLFRAPYYPCYIYDSETLSYVSTQKLALRESVTQIGFWFVVVEDKTCLTGLELISKDEAIPNGTMGYRSCNSELITVDIGSAEELRGFQVYSLDGIISGIRLYLGPPAELIPEKRLKFHSTEWVAESPQSNLQSNIGHYCKSSGKKIVGLGASFFGWKMTALQLGIEEEPKRPNKPSPKKRRRHH